MAFDRFNDKPARREKRDAERFGGKKGGRFDEFRVDRGFDRPQRKSFAGKPFSARPFKEELGGRSGPRARAVDKRRFSDRAAFVQNATVRLDPDVAAYFKSSEDVNAALRIVIALAKTVKTTEAKAQDEAKGQEPDHEQPLQESDE